MCRGYQIMRVCHNQLSGEIFMFLRYLSALTAFMLILSCTGCKSGKTTKREQHLQRVVQNQGKFQKLATGQEVDGERAAEATNWLEFTNTDNVLPSTTRKQTVGYVQSLLDAGAKRVMCIYVIKEATFRAKMCTSLLVEMPKEPAKRKEVLRAFNVIEKEFWGDIVKKLPEEDNDYLYLNMDP
jgi:hypothetical protein